MIQNPKEQDVVDPSNGQGTPTLKIAGAGYALGDVMMMLAGIARRGTEHALGTIGGGALWLAGGLAAARYGNPSTEKQLRIHASRLQQYLHEKGVVIPEDARARSDLLAQRSLWQKVEEYCYEHPSEMLNAAYSIGAGMVLTDGLKQIKHGKTLLPKTLTPRGLEGMSSNFWIGLIVLVGGLTGICVKEDPLATQRAEHEGPMAKLWAHVKEKPLRVSGTLFTANNGFLALRAWQDFEERTTGFAGKKFQPYYASTMQLASYLFSNAMLMMSYRDQMVGHPLSAESVERLEWAAARIIAVQPEPVQQALLHDIADHLAAQKNMGEDATILHTKLQQKLVQLTGERAAQHTKNPSGFAEAILASRQTLLPMASLAQ